MGEWPVLQWELSCERICLLHAIATAGGDPLWCELGGAWPGWIPAWQPSLRACNCSSGRQPGCPGPRISGWRHHSSRACAAPLHRAWAAAVARVQPLSRSPLSSCCRARHSPPSWLGVPYTAVELPLAGLQGAVSGDDREAVEARAWAPTLAQAWGSARVNSGLGVALCCRVGGGMLDWLPRVSRPSWPS